MALIVEYGLQAVFRGSFGLDHGARSAYLYPAAIFIWLAIAATLSMRLDPRNRISGRRRFVPLVVGLLIVPMALGDMTQFVLAANAMRPLRLTELRELALIEKLRDVPGLDLDLAADPNLLPQVTARHYFIAIDRFGTPGIPNHWPADYAGRNPADNTALNALAMRLLGGAMAIGPHGVPRSRPPDLNAASGTVAAGDPPGCTQLNPVSGEAAASWSPPTRGVAFIADEGVQLQLFVGVYEPADAPVDAKLLEAVRRGDTVWLPALPAGLSWNLTLIVRGDAAVQVCSKQ